MKARMRFPISYPL